MTRPLYAPLYAANTRYIGECELFGKRYMWLRRYGRLELHRTH